MREIEKVWHVNEGPFEDDEVEGLLFIIVLAEMDDGSMQEVDLYTGNFEHTYRFLRHTKRNLGPWTTDDVARIALGYDE